MVVVPTPRRPRPVKLWVPPALRWRRRRADGERGHVDPTGRPDGQLLKAQPSGRCEAGRSGEPRPDPETARGPRRAIAEQPGPPSRTRGGVSGPSAGPILARPHPRQIIASPDPSRPARGRSPGPDDACGAARAAASECVSLADFAPSPTGIRNGGRRRNLTATGREMKKSREMAGPAAVQWGHARDPAEPIVPRPDRRGGCLEGPDGPVSSPDHRLAQPPGRAGGRSGGPEPGHPPERGPAPARLRALRPPGCVPLVAAHDRLQPHGPTTGGPPGARHPAPRAAAAPAAGRCSRSPTPTAS